MRFYRLTPPGWSKRVEYTPGSGSIPLFPNLHLETCEETVWNIQATVELQTGHIGKGCDRDSYSDRSVRRLCGEFIQGLFKDRRKKKHFPQSALESYRFSALKKTTQKSTKTKLFSSNSHDSDDDYEATQSCEIIAFSITRLNISVTKENRGSVQSVVAK